MCTIDELRQWRHWNLSKRLSPTWKCRVGDVYIQREKKEIVRSLRSWLLSRIPVWSSHESKYARVPCASPSTSASRKIIQMNFISPTHNPPNRSRATGRYECGWIVVSFPVSPSLTADRPNLFLGSRFPATYGVTNSALVQRDNSYWGTVLPETKRSAAEQSELLTTASMREISDSVYPSVAALGKPWFLPLIALEPFERAA